MAEDKKNDKLKELLEKGKKNKNKLTYSDIADALDTVSPNIPMPSMASASLKDEEILTMIVSLYEGKSAPKQQVLDALIAKGLTPNEAKDRISLLMENGDIYAPKFNYLKVL